VDAQEAVPFDGAPSLNWFLIEKGPERFEAHARDIATSSLLVAGPAKTAEALEAEKLQIEDRAAKRWLFWNGLDDPNPSDGLVVA
jgi:hypothetical protein